MLWYRTMPVVRLLLFLGILAGLLLFGSNNWSPVLQLTFLGMKTPALPLAVWVLGAIAAGFLTNLLLTLLFRLSNYAAARQVRVQLRRATRHNAARTGAVPPAQPSFSWARASTPRTAPSSRTEDEDADWQNWEGYEEPVDRKPAAEPVDWKRAEQQPVDRTPQAVEDDWDTVFEDDWGEAKEKPRPAAATTSTRYEAPVRQEEDFSDLEEDSDSDEDDTPADEYQSRERIEFERRQEPRTASRSGSVYSYGYRDPSNPAVGRAESVVDAEYRVIIPPHRPLEEPDTQHDED
jgi:hypothetical protein